MTLAIFGIDNDGINLALNLLILFLVVIYLSLVAWVYLDARRRLEDPVLVACATVAALIPLAGPIVYSILRPPELLADSRERELEIRAAELRVRQLEESSCPNCEHPVERTYLRCPECRARIKDPCESCGKPVDPRWTLCPYCETPNRRAQAASASPPSKRRGIPGRSKESSRPSEGRKPRSQSQPQARPSSSSQSRPQRSPASVRSSETRPLKTPTKDDASPSSSSESSASSSSSSSSPRQQPSRGSSGGSGASSKSSPPSRGSSASRERPKRS
ncbi:hypothetical protein BH10ACT11_BH10ACT11_06060 [soil metagenome]